MPRFSERLELETVDCLKRRHPSLYINCPTASLKNKYLSDALVRKLFEVLSLACIVGMFHYLLR